MKRTLLLACALLVGVACTGEDAAPRTTGSPEEPPSITLEARGVPLFAGPDGAPRFAIESADRSANVIVTAYAAADRTKRVGQRPAPSGLRVSLCPLARIDRAPAIGEQCRNDIGLGVREAVSSRDFAGLAVVAQGTVGDVLADIVIQYAEAGRAVSITMPAVRGPVGGVNCSDNGCNPFFELRPTRNGRLTASATWDGPGAALVLLQGNILGRSQTATGIPYREAAIDAGAAPLAISSEMSAPGEYALALRHERLQPGEPALRDVRIDAAWP